MIINRLKSILKIFKPKINKTIIGYKPKGISAIRNYRPSRRTFLGAVLGFIGGMQLSSEYRIVEKISGNGVVRCRMRHLRKGDKFYIKEPNGMLLDSCPNCLIATSNPWRNKAGSWTIEANIWNKS